MASAIKFLATRIEEMENSFLTIFFEAATKMAESTESKLFFMMESTEGIRKIGGNKELKKLFYVGKLQPRNSDLTIGDDANVGEGVKNSEIPNPRQMDTSRKRSLMEESAHVVPQKSRRDSGHEIQVKEEPTTAMILDEEEAEESEKEEGEVANESGVDGTEQYRDSTQWLTENEEDFHEEGTYRFDWRTQRKTFTDTDVQTRLDVTFILR